MRMIAVGLDDQLVLVARIARGMRWIVLGSAVAGIAGAVWVMHRPGPSAPVVNPMIPGLSAAAAGSGTFTMAIPETLFRAPQAPPAGESARPIALEAATSWRVLGIDLESSQPAALMKESKDGKSVWVHLGDQLGGLTIKQIEAGRVVVEGGQGEFEIRL